MSSLAYCLEKYKDTISPDEMEMIEAMQEDLITKRRYTEPEAKKQILQKLIGDLDRNEKNVMAQIKDVPTHDEIVQAALKQGKKIPKHIKGA